MHRSHRWVVRLAAAAVTLSLLLTTLASIPPGRALAARGPSTLFRAEFDAAPLGPLAGPLNVETGQVVPQGGSVAVADTLFGRALALQGSSGQATALMQWLQATSPAVFIHKTPWAFTTIVLIHVFAISLVIGTIAIVDLRLLGLASTKRPFTELGKVAQARQNNIGGHAVELR